MFHNNRIVVLIVGIASLWGVVSAQNVNWVYQYNGPANHDDWAYSVVYGADGNIYAAGWSIGIGTSDDFTVISLTPDSTERWVYRYNGPGNGSDKAYSVVYGADGNIYAAGGGFTVISLTPDGTERWVYRYYAPGSNGHANSVVYGADGNIYAAGYSWSGGTSNDFMVISLTPDGTERWVYQYNGPGNGSDIANSVVYGADGNIYAAGYSKGSGTSDDFTVISLTPDCTERWVYRYNGPGNSADEAYSLVYGGDGNIYAAGWSWGGGTAQDFTVISLTQDGTERWVYRYNGPGNGYDWAKSVVYGADGNIYAAGWSLGSGTSDDFTVLSLTQDGTERWVYWYNGSGNGSDKAYSVVYGADSNIYAAGWSLGSGTAQDFTVISLTQDGTELWVYQYNGPGNAYDKAYSLVYGGDGNIYAAGYSIGSGTACDFTAISLTPPDSESPQVTVIFPNGGEGFIVGDTCDITWFATDNMGIDSISIFCSINAGMSWYTIATGEPNDSTYEWIIPDTPSDSCFVKLLAFDPNLNIGEDQSDSLFSISSGVGIEENISSPVSFAHLQIRPNPFSETTVISFQCPVISEKEKITLSIYDLSGRLVKSFTLTTDHLALSTATSWDGKDDSGNEVRSGVYFCRFVAGDNQSTKKLLLLR